MPIRLLSEGKRLLTLQRSRLPKLSSSFSTKAGCSGKARLPMLSIASVISRGGRNARLPFSMRLPTLSSSRPRPRLLRAPLRLLLLRLRLFAPPPAAPCPAGLWLLLGLPRPRPRLGAGRDPPSLLLSLRLPPASAEPLELAPES